MFLEFSECFHAFTLESTHFVLKIAELEVHLGAWMGHCWSWRTSAPWRLLFILETGVGAHYMVRGIWMQLVFLRASRTELLGSNLIIARWSFLSNSQLRLSLSRQCIWNGCVLGSRWLIILIWVTWFSRHSNGVDISPTISTTTAFSILQQLLACEEGRCQFLLATCIIDKDVIVVVVLVMIKSVREIGELVSEWAWSHIDIWWNHFFFIF